MHNQWYGYIVKILHIMNIVYISIEGTVTPKIPKSCRFLPSNTS